MKNKFSILILFLFLIVISGCATVSPGTEDNTTGSPEVTGPKVDDWQYDSDNVESDYARGGGTMMKSMAVPMAMESAMAPTGSANLGFAVGGAKDVNNFRENIKNGFLPISSDITYEGLFYGYFFDTGKPEECTKLFCPSYSTAVTKDPLSDKPEYYLSVGLNSGIKESDFKRKKLNLVVVMDISGSMGSPFDKYYYDRFGNRIELKDEEEKNSEDQSMTKMQIASKSVASLLDHLNNDDRFGLVLFDDDSYVAKPLTKVGATDMKKIKDHILELQERGGTYMEAGMKDGTKLLNELSEVDQSEYENRIIFITDAMPNIGDTSDEGLLDMLKKNAGNHIYTTFIGVGVDFNTELIEILTKIRGANYYSIHSSGEFKKVMDEDFDYMVTPLVFDLKLELEADGWEIEKVYGSPEADEATGEIMKVNTLFPSKTEGGETKGGIIILKLNKIGESGKLTLKTSYEDRSGKKDSDEKKIVFRDVKPDYYDNTGIRKGILLVRYANLMKDWLIDEIRDYDKPFAPCPPIIVYETGIRCPEYRCFPPMPQPCEIRLGEWERQSTSLHVAKDYKNYFKDFMGYFNREMKEIGDETLQQELDTLKLL